MAENRYAIRKRNINVWQETYRYFLHNKGNGNSNKYKWPLNVSPEQFMDQVDGGTIQVYNMDTLDCCKMLIQSGHKVAGHVMASASNPGGGVGTGQLTQEEEIWRRSDSFRYLPRVLYPLFGVEAIYVNDVTVVRESAAKQHAWLADPYQVDLIVVPAVTHPRVTYDDTDYADPREREKMERRAEMIFQLALINGRDALVLGAWGCGAFANPAPAVIKIFNTQIAKWGKKFKNISFAVLGKNYELFKNGIS